MTGQHQTVAAGSVAIQVAGDNVTISVGAASLTLAQRHRLKAVPTSERELLLTELRGTDLVGRDADLAALRAWLDEPRLLPAVRCLTGRGQRGRQSAACRFTQCDSARMAARLSGFAASRNMSR